MPTNNRTQNPIGVFDSGLGGLTVVKEIIRHLPFEQIVYFGDTARVPYGTKSAETIIRYAREIVGALLKYKVKMVVVACNTASSLALDVLKKEFDLPVLGVIEPGARKAAAVTRNKKVGVIATSSTVKSGRYADKITACDKKIAVTSMACPLFVPLVEEGWFAHEVTYRIAREYLKGMKKKKIDTLILGCTHYPLLKGVLHDVMGPRVQLVDSAREVALEVKEMLATSGLLRASSSRGRQRFIVTDEPKQFERLASRFLGEGIKDVRRHIYV
ncbi:MAG: glutamate racemase [Candidatus Omnitrophica bacterium]|nr:glutamate racemase [Candidatus Omnitrophota bacterium]MDE2008736.1 glutamate racemase [Candidatus Omnitrophota bacterium]MDE2215160.1 glutamate racemase [Candidatus Omnitrophota bacterium]MDE2232163.1 glutamate racemase [Candidatus Omnitrophota bacterium]